jgi:hypothetical protein
MTREIIKHNAEVWKDGVLWCAMVGTNLMECTACWGDTPEEAFENLLKTAKNY